MKPRSLDDCWHGSDTAPIDGTIFIGMFAVPTVGECTMKKVWKYRVAVTVYDETNAPFHWRACEDIDDFVNGGNGFPLKTLSAWMPMPCHVNLYPAWPKWTRRIFKPR